MTMDFKRRYSAWVMGMTVLLFGAASGILGPLLPAIGMEFDIDSRQTGFLLVITFIGAVVAIMAGGYLADRFGKKPLFLMLLGGLIVSYLGFFIAPTFSLVAAFCLLAGALGGALESLCSAVIADLEPARVERNMNFLQVAFCIGALVAVAVASEFRGQSISWRALYGVFAFCALTIWLLGLRIHVPPTPPADPIRLKIVWRLLADSGLRRLSSAIALYVSAEMSLAWLIVAILMQAAGYSEPVAIWGAGVFWGSMAVTRVGVALLCKHFSAIVLVRCLVVGGLAAFGIFFLPLGAWRYWVGISFAGVAFSGIWPLLVGMANARHPSYSGTVTSIMVTSGTIGGLVGPYLAVNLLHWDPSAVSSLAFMAFLFVGLALVIWSVDSGPRFRTAESKSTPKTSRAGNIA